MVDRSPKSKLDLEPIYHPEQPGDFINSDEWWECPSCGGELHFSPTHDVYTEGYAPEARPDAWTCFECPYRWAE